MNQLFKSVALSAALVIPFLMHSVDAADKYYGGGKLATYEIKITNVTRNQPFSPPLVVLHKKQNQLFKPGEEASEGLVALAEGGATNRLQDEIWATFRNSAIATADAPIGPGQSATITVQGPKNLRRLSVASMLVNTNDAFLAVNSVKVNNDRHIARAYDAGSEANTELCSHMPGPACPADSGNARMTDGAEGYIYVHNGIHGVGDISAAENDWKNPVAVIQIKKY